MLRRAVSTLHYYERTKRIEPQRIGDVRVFDRRDVERLAPQLAEERAAELGALS